VLCSAPLPAQGESLARLWAPFRTRSKGGYPVPLLPIRPCGYNRCLYNMQENARLLIEVRCATFQRAALVGGWLRRLTAPLCLFAGQLCLQAATALLPPSQHLRGGLAWCMRWLPSFAGCSLPAPL